MSATARSSSASPVVIFPSAAIVAAAAFLASTMRAPLTAIVLVIEFTATGFDLLLPIFLAVAGSLAASRLTSRASLRRFAPLDPGRE